MDKSCFEGEVNDYVLLQDKPEIMEWFSNVKFDESKWPGEIRIARKNNVQDESNYGKVSGYGCCEFVDIEFTCVSGTVYLLGYNLHSEGNKK